MLSPMKTATAIEIAASLSLHAEADGNPRMAFLALLGPLHSEADSDYARATVPQVTLQARQPFESSRVLGDRKGPCGFSGRVPLPGAEL